MKPMKPNALTRAQQSQTVHLLHKEELSPPAIANQLDIPIELVLHILDSPPPKYLPRDQALQLRQQGWTLRSISAQLQSNPSTVYRLLKKTP